MLKATNRVRDGTLYQLKSYGGIMRIKTTAVFTVILLSLLALGQAFSKPASAADDKLWEVVATKDQTFVVKGEKKPVIAVKAG